MDKSELLAQFVAKNDMRSYLKAPFVLGEFAYACNGHIAVRVSRDGLDFSEIENEAVRKIGDMFATSTRAEFADMPTLPEGIPCKQCHGSKVLYECDDCDGAGEFEHGMHDYDCKECEGSGQVSRRGSRQLPCNHCDGTGARNNQAVAVGVASYDRRYLEKIKDLPGLKFSPIAYEAKNNAGYFKFDGGEGLLMPMRV